MDGSVFLLLGYYEYAINTSVQIWSGSIFLFYGNYVCFLLCVSVIRSPVFSEAHISISCLDRIIGIEVKPGQFCHSPLFSEKWQYWAHGSCGLFRNPAFRWRTWAGWASSLRPVQRHRILSLEVFCEWFNALLYPPGNS